MSDDIKELLKALTSGGAKIHEVKMDKRKSRESKFSPEIELDIISSESKGYLEEYKPEVGDIMQWKSRALVHNSYPTKDGYLVVTEVLDKPLRNTNKKEGGDAYYGELENIRAMVIVEDGTAVCFMYDSKRFKKVGNIYAGSKKGKGGIKPVK